MDDIYTSLINDMPSLKEASEEVSGMDDFLSGDRVKISSLRDLVDFNRVGEDTLVHKSKKDLWRIGEDEKGDVVIERLFDPDTKEALKI